MPILGFIIIILVVIAGHFISQAWENAKERVTGRAAGEEISSDKLSLTEKIQEGEGMEAMTDVAEKGVNFFQGPITNILIVLAILGLVFPIFWLLALVIIGIKYALHKEGIPPKTK